MPMLSSADFFQNYFLKKKKKSNLYEHYFRMPNGLDQDQDRHSVGPDLGSNCLQRLSADDKSCR